MPSFIGFIPTPHEQIEAFFELVTLSSTDVVYDLGCGDGRLLFAALDKGAGRVVGVDLNPEHLSDANKMARKRGLEDRVKFLESDVLEVNLHDASVVLCYLSSRASAALKAKFEVELKPGTRVIMESFPVPGWKPVRILEKEYKKFFLYLMPPQASQDYVDRDAFQDYLNRKR